MSRMTAGREEIVAILAEVFREHGYEGASLKLITERTGLGKGSLYHFFPDGKEEMAAAVLEEISGWFEVNIYRPLEEMQAEVAVANMFEAVNAYFRSGRRICLLGAFALDDSRDRFPKAVRVYFDRWLASLATCLERGGFAAGEARQAAQDVVAGIQGYIVLARALNDPKIFRDGLLRLGPVCMK